MSAKVEMYTKNVCPYCVKAKELLKMKNIHVVEHNIETDPSKRAELLKRVPGVKTVPQIFINDKLIGGCDNLYALEEKNELDILLK